MTDQVAHAKSDPDRALAHHLNHDFHFVISDPCTIRCRSRLSTPMSFRLRMSCAYQNLICIDDQAQNLVLRPPEEA